MATATTARRPHLVPAPRSLTWLDGAADLSHGLTVTGADKAAHAVGLLEEALEALGLRLTRVEAASVPSDTAAGGSTAAGVGASAGGSAAEHPLELRLANAPALAEEAYELTVRSEGITLAASSPAGFGWGVQTLFQLLPAPVLAVLVDPAAGTRLCELSRALTLPACHIEDAPENGWRGSHIDLARHFLPFNGLLRHMRAMALHKLNVLHLHLTDDQGWRLPIADYPLLEEIAAYRPGSLVGHQPEGNAETGDDHPEHDGIRHGGFLSLAEIGEIRRLAERLGITLLPEVDMPGHMEAAIAAYPELGACDHVRHPRTCWGVSRHVLALDERTLDFCRTVLDTTMDLFPGSPIHVGGDEVPGEEMLLDPRTRETMARIGASTRAEAQAWFEAQVCGHVLQAGHQVVAWDEVVEGDIDPAVTIMVWRDWEPYAAEAIKRGHEVIAAPNSLTYLDHDQVLGEHRPVSIGGELSLATTAQFTQYLAEQRALVSEAAASATAGGRLLGGQFQLWTEYVPDWQRAEDLLWPRGASLAQQLWSGTPEGAASYEELGEHLERLTALGLAWCPESEYRG